MTLAAGSRRDRGLQYLDDIRHAVYTAQFAMLDAFDDLLRLIDRVAALSSKTAARRFLGLGCAFQNALSTIPSTAPWGLTVGRAPQVGHPVPI